MKKTFYQILTIMMLFDCFSVEAQESEKLLSVNGLIGDTLDQQEQNYYRLFPQFDEFQFAIFYLNPDSTLNAEAHYLLNGISKDTLIQDYRSLKSLNYHINARKALENNLPITEYKSFEQTEGDIVNVFKTNDAEVSGELLYVRRNSILLLKQECNNNVFNLDCVDNINRTEIDKVLIKGNSNLGWGIGLGILASVIVGTIIFESYDDGSFMWGYDAISPTILSMVGCISLGVIIGISTSTADEIINPSNKYEYQRLIEYSRYQFNEPDELNKIQWVVKWKNI